VALQLRDRLRLTIDREAWRRRLWVPVAWLALSAVWMAQAVDALLSDDGTGLHVLAAVTFVLVIPFASFWAGVVCRKYRHRPTK
jgi:hypothetical protein